VLAMDLGITMIGVKSDLGLRRDSGVAQLSSEQSAGSITALEAFG